MKQRCAWCGDDALYQRYHDEEWGVPCYDEAKLFEMLNLEGAQAGLSWITILRKRHTYREAFDDFNPELMAAYDEQKRIALLDNPGIVRNRLKVNAFIENAKAWLALLERGESPAEFLWSFTNGKVIQNQWLELSQVPAVTKQSEQMSKALKKVGFRFVGPTICYAFMQACGMVNDHTLDCYRHQELS